MLVSSFSCNTVPHPILVNREAEAFRSFKTMSTTIHDVYLIARVVLVAPYSFK